MMDEISMQNTEDVQLPAWKFWMKRRYINAILTMLGFFNIYSLRANLSIAIVAMTANNSHTWENDTVFYEPEFEWSSGIQGYVLSSFFYGYITTQLVGGWLGSKIGGKRVFGLAVGMTAFLTLLTPTVAKFDVYLLIFIRVVMGVFEGVSYPSIHAMWSKWAPPLERGRLSSIGYSGSYIGNVVAMPASAALAENVGWESIFYVFGGIALVWFVLWWIFVADSPAQDGRITQQERDYIEYSLKNISSGSATVKSYPWKAILTSMPFWACVVANFCENWGFYTMVTLLPKFMKEALNFDLGKAGFMSALPYLAVYITIQVSGYAADWILINNYMSVTNIRKLFNCGAFIGQAVFMLIAIFWLHPEATTLCITAGIGLGGFSYSGFIINYLDLSPRHAGVLMGIGNTFATIPGIVSPIIAGHVVSTPTVDEWRIVFYIACSVYLFGAVIYFFFASGELQPWAYEVEEEELRVEKNGHDNLGYKNS